MLNEKELLNIIMYSEPLTFKTLNKWSENLGDCPEDVLNLIFQDKQIDVVQLSKEYEKDFMIQNLLSVEEYVQQFYSKAVSLLLSIPKMKAYLLEEKLNINNNTFLVYLENGFMAIHAQQILFSLSNEYVV